MGLIVAGSGIGKSSLATAYKFVHPSTVVVTGRVDLRTPRAVLLAILRDLWLERQGSTNSLFDRLLERCKNSSGLFIFDDCQFFTWETFELLRQLHDAGDAGILLLAQARVFEIMRGELFEQIRSRVSIVRSSFPVRKADVRMIARSIVPDLEDNCVDFLFEVGKGQGRFRSVSNLLNLVLNRPDADKTPITVDVLRELERFLMR
jgi:DNA transposition AAA+ family ATPase